MSEMGQKNSETTQIQRLLENHLRFRSTKTQGNNKKHLDEDILSAFVEGKLVAREVGPVINHLVECSFCCHITAELVKLDLAFAEEKAPLSAEVNPPKKVSEVLSGLFSKIFGTTDGAVFAHQEPEEEKEKEKETPKDK